MKRERFKPPEPDDPFCCCDCEELDDVCERLLCVDWEKPSPLSRFLPGHMDLSVLPPMVLLPVLLRVAALHCMLGVVVLTALPVLVLWYYYVTHRKKRRTLFFLTLALFSLAYMYFLFITEILPRGTVGTRQVVTVTTGMIMTLVSLARTKRGPGFVRADPTCPVSCRGATHCNGVSQSESPGGKKWCPVCRLVRPERAGHCRICGECVLRMDHHCVWINCCIGQANHKHFLLTLLLFLMTSLYGISMVLRSVCPRQSIFIAPLYCPGVYTQYSTALCFTCVWYSCIVTGALCYLLVLQLVNVSCNVTEREVHIALRNRIARSRYFGIVVETGTYTRGFVHNWIEFLTMNTHHGALHTHTHNV
ncbi:palmitoyltransferase ZDHHC23-A isoform 1-T1 [Clarias gariepinus]|uniref:palmitoyltransferase ZDHHC23-A-like isoform X1 n=1 Tax=Clarias gariepinus TaxID=13013 RepID=UPI00234E2DF8|nr:palmitoyltransferase ZDHHC23-A-like isoform X1 [Clarias gariepinus]